MISKASVTAQSWGRLIRWAAAACVLVLGIGWGSTALAATPAWWDCSYGYRKQITVNAGSAAVPNGYTMSLTFNHSSLVSAGKSQADGDDIRVLYWNGSAWAQVDRFVDPGSSWNSSTTKIWFKLQAAIAASGSNGNHYLYYGNDSAANPPASPSNVFLLFDGFESGNLSAWSGSATTAGDTIAASNDSVGQNGTWSLKAVTDTTPDPVLGYSYGFAWKNITGQTSLYAKLNVWVPSSFSAGTNDVVIMEFQNNWNNIISVTINAEDRTLFMWKEGGPPAGPFGYGDPPSTPLLIGWNTIEMMATASTTAGEARVWLNGSLEIEATGQNLGSNPIDKVSAGIFYSIPEESANTIYIDDVVVRSWVDPAPSIALGTELAQDCTPPAGFNACDYQYRQKITVTAGSSAVPSGYSVLLTLNHASLVSAGKSQADGDDIRIVYTSGSGGVELDRFLDPGASWNNSATKIWFKTQAAISASGSDSSYYIYYGNTGATNPAANPSNVFFFYDGYESGTFGAWDGGVGDAGPGCSITIDTSTVHTGTYSARASVDGGSDSDYARVMKTITGQAGLHATTFVHIPTGYNSTEDITVIHFYTGGWTKKVSSLAIRGSNDASNDRKPLHGNWQPDNASPSFTFGSPALTTGAWHRLEQKVIVSPTSGRIEVWQDGVRSVNLSNQNTGDAATEKIDFTLFDIFWQNGSSTAATLYFDNTFLRLWVDPEPTVTLSAEETVGAHGSYFTPDAAAAGMNVPVTFVGDICVVPTITTSSSDIVMGPRIVTDASGNVVTQDGRTLSTVFFVKPEARPGTAITVYADGQPLAHTFNIVVPSPDPNAGGSLSGRTKRGTKVLGGLTVGSGQTLTIDTGDADAGTAGNQGYLPATILVKGDVNIAGTIDVKGQNGANGAAGSGGAGGAGGPGGGGGGGGGVKQNGTAAAGGAGYSGGGGGGSKGTSGGAGITFVRSGGVTGTSFSLDIGTAGTNRLVVVFLGHENADQPSIQVTIDGKNATHIRTAHNALNGDNHQEMWYADEDNLGASAGTVTIAFTGGDANWAIHAHLYTGVIQSGPQGSWYNNTAINQTTIPVTGVNVPANGLVIMGAGQGSSGSATSWTSPLTERTDGPNPLSAVLATASVVETATQTGKTYTSTMDVTFNRGTGIVAAFAQASGGGGGTGGAGGDGTGAAGMAPSGTTGGAGGIALSGASGGGGGTADTALAGGAGGGGGTGNPYGTGGSGGQDNGGLAGQGGGGGGASGGGPGGGGGGGFATAGTRGPDDPDAGYGGNATGNLQLVPLAGGSGGGGGGPDVDVGISVHTGGGGGGGGGAVLIFATGAVTVSGTITAAGGNGANGYSSGADGSGGGGGGSGGAIFLQSSQVTASGTLTTPGGTAGTSGSTNGAGGAGGTGRIRIDGLATGTTISTITGTAGSRHIGPVIDSLVDTSVKGRADGGATVTLYVYDQTGAQVSGSPYSTSAGGSSGSVGTWTITNVTFPSGTGYLAVKQTSGGVQVLGPGRATKGLHIINWREVY